MPQLMLNGNFLQCEQDKLTRLRKKCFMSPGYGVAKTNSVGGVYHSIMAPRLTTVFLHLVRAEWQWQPFRQYVWRLCNHSWLFWWPASFKETVPGQKVSTTTVQTIDPVPKLPSLWHDRSLGSRHKQADILVLLRKVDPPLPLQQLHKRRWAISKTPPRPCVLLNDAGHMNMNNSKLRQREFVLVLILATLWEDCLGVTG